MLTSLGAFSLLRCLFDLDLVIQASPECKFPLFSEVLDLCSPGREELLSISVIITLSCSFQN